MHVCHAEGWRAQLCKATRWLGAAQVCNHPYLLHHTRPEEEDECEVVGVATKWQLLDRLVPKLAAGAQRTLILSQTAKSLDLVQVRPSFRRPARLHFTALDAWVSGHPRCEVSLDKDRL